MTSSPDGAALERARKVGIHCISVSTPFLVGLVNCYLIEDDPLTLIDTGPNSGKAFDELEQGLAGLGYSVSDLKRIVITHQHMDHLGLVDVLHRRSGAEIAALNLLSTVLYDYNAHAEKDDQFAEKLMRLHGIPPDVVVALRSVSRSFRAWGASANVTQPLTDNGTLEFSGRRFTVWHRPGHSPSDTVFWDPDSKILIAGDHLIAHISSNPLIHLPLEDLTEPSERQRPQALIAYLRSLQSTQKLPAETVLSGHGAPIDDHVRLIDDRFRGHDRRAEKIHELLRSGPKTVYELAQALWGNVAVTQAYLTLCEVLGHLDLLAERGQVTETTSNGSTHFVIA